ncbi:MAG: c-type cytochrome [Lentisphaeraceae bacterium]|nr:c-type cytochrome [Lentisphaeraceae bacterium]
MNFKNTPFTFLLLFAITFQVYSQAPKVFKGPKKTKSTRTTPLTPMEQLEKFKLKDGFIIELVASEEDGLINPIDLTFDDAGRLWTQTAQMYPMDPLSNMSFRQVQKMMSSKSKSKFQPALEKTKNLYQLKTKGIDKILVIENNFSPDAQKKVKVWAEGLSIPQSILPYKDGAFIAHGSEMLFLNDSDGDGKSDEHKSVLTGFGYTDTHTMSHTLVRGPGGWVHFSHGAMNKGLVTVVKSGHKQNVDYSKIVKFSLDGEKLELVNAGLNNIWGFQLRGKGQWYGTEANDKGYSVLPMEPQTAMYGIGNEKLYPYQPFLSPLHEFRVGGTGISGLAFADDTSGSFPKEWQDIALLANPISSTINSVKIVRNEDGTVAAEHLEDLLTCEDDWFRPVNIEFGPDGCLYIADWYNKVISHNEVPRTHPDRDRKHGRIWRIRHVSQKPVEVKNYYEVPNESLVDGLKAPSIWEKRAAWHQVSDRQTVELVPALVQLLSDVSMDETTRIMALWSLESLSHFDVALMKILIKESPVELQREAIRALSGMAGVNEHLVELLTGFENHKNPMIRSQVLRTIAACNFASPEVINLLVNYCRPKSKAKYPALGGEYEREFERFLARKALEQFPLELNTYLKSKLAKSQPASHLAWASEALSSKDKVTAFMKTWKKQKNKPLSEQNFLTIAEVLAFKGVYPAVKKTYSKQIKRVVGYALKHREKVQSVLLTKLLKESLVGQLKPSEDIALLMSLLKLVEVYNISGLEQPVSDILASEKQSEKVLLACLKVFNPKTEVQTKQVLRILNSTDYSSIVTESAFKTLLKAKSKASVQSASVYFQQLPESKKRELVSELSATFYGSVFICGEMERDKSLEALVNYKTLEKISQYNPGNDYMSSLLNRKKSEMKKVEDERKKKVEVYVQLIESGKGSAASGKPLFEALCLSCHSVGKTGVGFAPPLDGSAHRDNHGLVTSILDPSAAAEATYYVYRVTKKDGSIIEGFCEKQDARGVTMRFMGGGKLFIPISEIKARKYLFGKSVMPSSLIDGMNTSQVADILAYIKSLK